MNSILTFRPRKAAADPSPKRGGAPATIIIFPGVRYERQFSSETVAGLASSPWLAKAPSQPLLTT